MSQPKTEEQLRRKAMKYLESKTTEVSCFNAETEGNVPRFHPREIQTGDFLGAGGFCTVCEVSGVKLKSASSNEEEKKYENASVKSFGGKIVQDREFIASHIYRDDCARYAIKKLSPTLFRKPAGTFLSGVIDLAMEVKYLAVIQHPHIIKMRAVSSSHPCSDTFFIVLDRLYETLSERITSWKKDTKKFRGFGMAVRRLSGGAKVKNDQNTLLAERLLVAHDVCSALAYLHENSIVYRDIKPDNIGFDIRGDVKIFDFGLAKELSECHRVKNTDVFKLTKKCGSPRYMAPEVFNSKPYNHSVDVYAFGLMLWQICECKTPFEDYSYEKLEDEVMTRNMRPAINDKSTPAAVNNIIEKSWSHHMKTRPECRDILKQLKDQIVIQCGDQVLDGMDVSGRTEASIKAMQEG